MESTQIRPKIFGEAEAGIQEYISGAENTTITCAIKHRFSDFIVNEIDEQNKVVWFTPETDLQKWKKTNIANTTAARPEDIADDEEAKEFTEKKELDVSLPADMLDQLSKLLHPEDFSRLSQFLSDLKDGILDKTSTFTFDHSIDNKDQRSQVHQLFKSTNIYETDTLMEGTSRRIRLFLAAALSQNKRRKLNIVNRKTQEEQDAP